MKLSGAAKKLTRVLAAVTFAGAILIAVAPAAEAQHFAVGVRIGGPRYVAPAPVYYDRGPVYVAPRFYDGRGEWARHEEWVRHDRFDRDHRFNDRGYHR
jgi:hypothetical protein